MPHFNTFLRLFFLSSSTSFNDLLSFQNCISQRRCFITSRDLHSSQLKVNSRPETGFCWPHSWGLRMVSCINPAQLQSCSMHFSLPWNVLWTKYHLFWSCDCHSCLVLFKFALHTFAHLFLSTLLRCIVWGMSLINRGEPHFAFDPTKYFSPYRLVQPISSYLYDMFCLSSVIFFSAIVPVLSF